MRAAPATPVALVLALAVSVTTCRLDKLINPATADRLTVNPDSLRDSAHVGSTVARTRTVRVASADGVTLPWSATKTAAWVTLSPTPDSIIVTLHPDTLSQTLHRDTIVFTSTQTKDTVRLPVLFAMLPPAAELVVTPASDAETAFVGSALLDTGWVTLSDSGGTVPARDTTSTIVTVTVNPDSLGPGTHRGAITISAS